MSMNLTHRHVYELKKVLAYDGMFASSNAVGKFVDRYIVCEVIAKKIISYVDGTYPHNLHTSTIISSCKHFEIDGNGQITAIINSVFLKKDKRGSKSPRSLRNSIVHSPIENDIEEINNRFYELYEVMESWLEIFKAL